MTISLAGVQKFVEEAEILRPTFKEGVAQPTDTLTGVFDTAKNQATVVGADVFSFVTGVTAEGREAIVNASLLAQLVAKKKVPDSRKVEDWYKAYFDTLTNVGWVIQQQGFADYKQAAINFEAHNALVALLTTLFGAGTTALTMVTSFLTALHSMDDSRPWITIFNRETQQAQTGHFQISLVDKDAGGEFLVQTIAFAMQAKSDITQVLFFKARIDEVKLRHDSSKVTIASSVALGVLPALRAKLATHVSSYIAMVDI